MPKTNLTQLAVERLKPPPADNVTYWDTTLPGFGVRVSSKGRKTWVAMYRVKGGKEVMETLGTTMTIPKLAEARELARASKRKAETGVNPVEERRAVVAQVEAKTFSWLIEHEETDKLGRKRTRGFIEQYAKGRQRPGTLYETRRILKRVKPHLGDKPISEIKRSDITRMLDDIAAERTRRRAGAQGGPNSEARAIQVCLNTVFRWAVEEEHMGASPMVGIRSDRHGRTPARERVLDDLEIMAFWSAMEAINWPFGPIGKLLLLTGQREGEVAGMRWSELDLPSAVWKLPGQRTKNKRPHIVHLAPQVMEIIEQLPRFEDDLVFSTTGTTVVSGFGNAKERVDALMSKELTQEGRELERWVWHDLRRTAVTKMHEIGIMPHVIEALVNHVSGHKGGIAGVYNHAEYTEERRKALEAWGRYVEELVTDSSAENVVQLRPPA